MLIEVGSRHELQSTIWVVGDTLMAETFAYGYLPSLVVGSAAGTSCIWPAAGSPEEGMRLTVMAAAPLGIGEAMVRTDGADQGDRAYRLEVDADYVLRADSDRESGFLSVVGASGPLPEYGYHRFEEGFRLELAAALAAGTHGLDWPDDGSPPRARVFVQNEREPTHGYHGPHSRYFFSKAGSTVTFNSISYQDGTPVVHGEITIPQATEYTAQLVDLTSVTRETGVIRDVFVAFSTPVDFTVHGHGTFQVLDGPDNRSGDMEVFLYTTGKMSFRNTPELWFQLRHGEYTKGTYPIGAATAVDGRWGDWEDPDHLTFGATGGELRIDERIEAGDGFPTILRGVLAVTGPLMNTDGVVVDSLDLEIEFAVSDQDPFDDG